MSDYAKAFVEHLETLKSRDRGALATLRHSLAFEPGAYPPAYPHVERFVRPGEYAQSPQRLALYIVAGLYARNPVQAGRSFAATLGVLMRDRDSESIEHRFVALLGADPENLHNYLRQSLTLLAADDRGCDYAALLEDVSRWINPRIDPQWRDRIRQRWARDFYRALSQSSADGQEQANR